MKPVLALSVALLILNARIAASEDNLMPMERVGIRSGEQQAEFFLKGSMEPFFATGFNYIRLRSAEGATGGDGEFEAPFFPEA